MGSSISEVIDNKQSVNQKITEKEIYTKQHIIETEISERAVDKIKDLDDRVIEHYTCEPSKFYPYHLFLKIHGTDTKYNHFHSCIFTFNTIKKKI